MVSVSDRIEEREKVNRWRILGYLNEQLRKLDEVGEIKTVLTYSRSHKKISCYGKWIPDDILIARFNPSIGVHKVSYPRFRQLAWLKSCHGDFVRLQKFEPQYDNNLWVALLGFPVDPNRPRLRFPAE